VVHLRFPPRAMSFHQLQNQQGRGPPSPATLGHILPSATKPAGTWSSQPSHPGPRPSTSHRTSRDVVLPAQPPRATSFHQPQNQQGRGPPSPATPGHVLPSATEPAGTWSSQPSHPGLHPSTSHKTSKNLVLPAQPPQTTLSE